MNHFYFSFSSFGRLKKLTPPFFVPKELFPQFTATQNPIFSKNIKISDSQNYLLLIKKV